jgi:hypothetical protein
MLAVMNLRSIYFTSVVLFVQLNECQVEPCTFVLSEYAAFIASITLEVNAFRKAQSAAVAREEARWVWFSPAPLPPA